MIPFFVDRSAASLLPAIYRSAFSLAAFLKASLAGSFSKNISPRPRYLSTEYIPSVDPNAIAAASAGVPPFSRIDSYTSVLDISAIYPRDKS